MLLKLDLMLTKMQLKNLVAGQRGEIELKAITNRQVSQETQALMYCQKSDN
jgi:hypothetical protein